MSGERRKTNKQYTGTVPKVKHHNNTCMSNDQELPRNVSNNLTNAWPISQPDFTNNIVRNPRRNQQSFVSMDTSMDEGLHNGIAHFNLHANGTASPNPSTSVSRRNSTSSTLKCDNVTKYPDKKQIEDKLAQIREYLQITTSLMTSMKNTEDQKADQAELENLQKMAIDLQDSEQKLVDILERINKNVPVEISEVFDNIDTKYNQIIDNGNDNYSDQRSLKKNEEQDFEMLREQQQQLTILKQKAETKMKDIRQIQESLAVVPYANLITNQKDVKNMMSIADIDAAISELEERTKKLNRPNQNPFQDRILNEVETLHNQIVTMHNANNERDHLIEVLDNRDSELKSQQVELQNKLTELQNKKTQIGNLVVQLQSVASEDGEEIGNQVKKIVSMKEQLKKLKDMLEIVKTTENISNMDVQAGACGICITSENYLQNEFPKPSSNANDNITPNESLSQKQINKNSRDQSKKAKSRTSSINEKLVLQAELEAKKKELEEIMGKHKAGTSNLNHDVGIDTKSEFSCTSNTINERGYWPLQNQDNSDRFSSDEVEDDDYLDLHNNRNLQPLPSLNYQSSKSSKQRSENIPEYEFPTGRLQSSSCTPERNVHDNSGNISSIQEQPRANNIEADKLQKQLQLIKSMCDSMIEQQNLTNQQQNVQHLRNNLTPSPLYSEPRFISSNSNSQPANGLNGPWFSQGNQNSNVNGQDINYQGWLATNTLQTQSFMLNTLNQCCQMLWFQQRELASLRNTVSTLQDRMETSDYHLPNPTLHPSHQPLPRPQPTPKPNQVSAACSMPNLNHYNAPPSNLEVYSNLNGRLLDPCLNNVNDIANNALHGVNTNLNQSLSGQMWHGQALNNQVPPGNRANNYWDNFRSYSRQNLLSTKNIDGFHNPASSLDRSNTGSDRTNPFTFLSFSKSNSEQDSSTSQETTPQRRAPFKWHTNANTTASISTDELNMNRRRDGRHEWLQNGNIDETSGDINMGLNVLNLNSTDSNSLHSEEYLPKVSLPKPLSRQNNDGSGGNEQRPQKSKLFEELRDNVYKEVASLISANEARPHFLIQLFRDLQMIGSDTLRLKILQSIQSVITHSLMSSSFSNLQPIDSRQSKENENAQIEESFSLQSTVWSEPIKNLSSAKNMPNLATENMDVANSFKDIIPFLNERDDEIIQHNLLINLKQMFLDSECLKGSIKDSIFKKHFSNVLDEVLEQFCDKSVRDVKKHLMQTLLDLLKSELSFIQLIQETNSEPISLATHEIMETSPSPSFNQKTENIQNGDLAEADQTRIIDENMEEVGAVGGIVEVKDSEGLNNITEIEEIHNDMVLTFIHVGQEVEVKSLSKGNSEEILNQPWIEFPCNTEGLDQVPTRLPIKNKSRSATPNKEKQ